MLAKDGHIRWWAAGLCFAFFTCAAMYSILVPIWEAPDEPEHFQYVRYLVEHRALPSRLPTIQPDGNQEGSQPPLFYLLAVPLAMGVDMQDAVRIRLNPHLGWPHDPAVAAHVRDEEWPYHGAVFAAHRVRLLSALLGTLTVGLTYAVATTALRSRRLGILSAALVAVLPGFLFASATIDNDMLVDAGSAALLLIVLKVTSATVRRSAVLFGVVAALSLLGKLDAVVPIAAGLAAIIVRSGRGRRTDGVLFAIAPIVLALGFWLWRLTLGERNLLGGGVKWPPPLPGSQGPLNWAAAWQFAVVLGRTFFGGFGWPNIWLPTGLYLCYGLLVVGGLALASCWLVGSGEPRKIWRDALLLACWTGLMLGAVIGRPLLVYGDFSSYGHSRFFYPALPAVATLTVFGWSRLAQRFAVLRQIWAPVLALAAAVAVATPWLFIRPAYPPPYPVDDHVPAHAAPVVGGGFTRGVTLAAVTLPTAPVGAGQGTYLTFYWAVQQPLSDGTWLFIHVEDAAGHTVAAFDGVPLYGTFPLTFWRQGDVIDDRELLTIHKDAASGVYVVHVGWYNPKTGQRLVATSGGNQVLAGSIQVVAK